MGVQEAASLGWSSGTCHCTLSRFQQRLGGDLGPSWRTQLWPLPLGSDKSCHQLQGTSGSLCRHYCSATLTLQVKVTDECRTCSPGFWSCLRFYYIICIILCELLFYDSTVRLHAMTRCILFFPTGNNPHLVREESCFHGVILARWCSVSVVCVVMGEWVGERVSDFVKSWRICSCSQKKWEQMTKEQPGLAWHLTVSYGMFHPLRSPSPSSLSLFDSYAALAWYPRLRPTNEDVSLLLKTMAITKMTRSFPSSHPLPPPRQMDRGESQTVFFKSISASVLFACVYGLMKWQSFFYRTGTFKAAGSSAEVPFLSVLLLHGEMGVRGHSERLKWNMG